MTDGLTCRYCDRPTNNGTTVCAGCAGPKGSDPAMPDGQASSATQPTEEVTMNGPHADADWTNATVRLTVPINGTASITPAEIDVPLAFLVALLDLVRDARMKRIMADPKLAAVEMSGMSETDLAELREEFGGLGCAERAAGGDDA